MEKQARYETLLANSKDMEMQKIRRMGYRGAEAEAYYNEWFEKATVDAVQRASGFSPSTVIEKSE